MKGYNFQFPVELQEVSGIGQTTIRCCSDTIALSVYLTRPATVSFGAATNVFIGFKVEAVRDRNEAITSAFEDFDSFWNDVFCSASLGFVVQGNTRLWVPISLLAIFFFRV